MGEMTFDKKDLEEVNFQVDPDCDLGWEQMKELSRQHGGTFFLPRVVKLNNYKYHGEVYSGELNWFFVVSRNPSIVSSDDDTRKYHVHAFTPRCRVLKPHDKETPFARNSQHLILSSEDTAIRTAKDLAKRDLDPKQYRWY